MRNLHLLDQYRLTGQEVIDMWGFIGDETCGAFCIPSPTDGGPINIIASTGLGWDHVSVSRKSRCPNWPEMEHVKRMFFKEDEVAMQLHVGEKDHISAHPYCLHIWRPNDGREIPLPPKATVA